MWKGYEAGWNPDCERVRMDEYMSMCERQKQLWETEGNKKVDRDDQNPVK